MPSFAQILLSKNRSQLQLPLSHKDTDDKQAHACQHKPIQGKALLILLVLF